ncbi:MAG: sulfur carrier protein ThiS [Synergistaceae bacterium]|jgi:sulfur carrier protein|nr:sulfur carrier protein ThiS [Synergistaceae bacterium]
MNIVVSGTLKEYPEGLSVSRLIEAENIETPMYVSVSVNDEFVKSGELDSTVLRGGDVVEFLYFMGGGRR